MRTLTIFIIMLLAMGPMDAYGRSYLNLLARYKSSGSDPVFYFFGDSWTCNAQITGERVSWSSDEAGSTTAQRKYEIWLDPTTTHGAQWANQLCYRLGVRKYAVEAIGGAELCIWGDEFKFANGQICDWVDDLLPYGQPDIVFGYGGINNLLGYYAGQENVSREYAKIALMGFVELMRDTYPNAAIVVPTWQPCGLIHFRYKDDNFPTAVGALSWNEVADLSVAVQVRQDSLRTWIMDTLNVDLMAAGIDTSLIFPYDLFAGMVEPDEWDETSSLREDAQFKLDLSALTGPLSYADSVKYNKIRYLKTEFESDSIHANNPGLREIGDLMAAQLFSVDTTGFAAGDGPKTIYVDKENGDNWVNRMTCTNRATPLATIQAAALRAFPGDTIRVIGDGNQSLMSYDSVSEGDVSSTTYELYIPKPNLTFICEDGAYYSGVYGAAAKTHGATVGTSHGRSFLHETGHSGWDSKELTPVTGLLWDSSMPTITLNARFVGFEFRGGYLGWTATNWDDVSFTDCVWYPGNSVNGINFQHYGNGDGAYTLNFTDCIFNVDDVTYGTGDGHLNFSEAGASTDDEKVFDGVIRGCQFLGDDSQRVPLVVGLVDGFYWYENKFIDPDCSAFVISGTRNLGPIGKQRWVNNYIDVENVQTGGSADTYFYVPVYIGAYNTTADADSFIAVNNIIAVNGTSTKDVFYRGPYDSTKVDFDRNIFVNSGYVVRSLSSASQQKALATLISDGAAASGDNFVTSNITASDSIYFGGRMSFTNNGSAYTLANFEIEHGQNHASIGPTQYSDAPYVSLDAVDGIGEYAQMESPWALLQLVNLGLAAESDSLDPTTWYDIYPGTSLDERTQYDLYIDAYNAWPEPTRRKIRWMAK